MRLEPGIWPSCLPIAACRRSFCALPSPAAPLWGGSLQPRPLQWGQLSCPSSSPVWLSWPESSGAGYKREDQVSAAAQGSTAQDSADAPCKKNAWGARPTRLARGSPGRGTARAIPAAAQSTPAHGCSGPGCPLGDGVQCGDDGEPPASCSTTQTCLLSLPQPAGGGCRQDPALHQLIFHGQGHGGAAGRARRALSVSHAPCMIGTEGSHIPNLPAHPRHPLPRPEPEPCPPRPPAAVG